jgi:Zn-dependent protease
MASGPLDTAGAHQEGDRTGIAGAPGMPGAYSIGKVAGIEISIHYTWLFAVALIAWSLAAGYYPADIPGLGVFTYWVIGVVSAVLLFASVLAHELMHSLVARTRGIRVDSITLFIFGGISNLASEPTAPGDEFFISVVGPISSFVLAAIFGMVAVALPQPGVAGAVAGYLAVVNLLLGIFNLIPGFPLDGGRVFRSLVWGVTGSLRRATLVASYSGQGFGWLLILGGLLRLLGGDIFGGLWIAFIGWFLNSAAESVRQDQSLDESLRGVAVSKLMDVSPGEATTNMSVQDFVFQEADLAAAIRVMGQKGLHQLPVVEDGGGDGAEGGHLRGLISREDVVRFLQCRQELRV